MQNVEAEDKILGPLTFKQFVFALIFFFLMWITYVILIKGLTWLLIITGPLLFFFGFFAFPFGRDQPTEVWAMGKLRYWFKPRKRVWNQSGIKELVTITVPKKIEHIYTDGLSQNEVKSRLQVLASTIDSRGWAVKNVNVNSYTAHPFETATSDRLIDMSKVPQTVSDSDIVASDDILDEKNNPIARQFDNMITQSSEDHRQLLIDEMNSPQATITGVGQNSWFTTPSVAQQPPAGPGPVPQQPSPPQATIDPDEATIAKQLADNTRNTQAWFGNLRTIQPLKPGDPVQQPVPPPQTQVSPPPAPKPPTDPAILSLANNDDLNVSTLAHEARRAKGEDDPNEVVISLH